MESLNLSSTPQFSKADYGQPAKCRECKQPVVGPYYTANGEVVCAPCGERLTREGHHDRPGAFIRALLAGTVAAIIGLALYAGFTILTGVYFGYVAFAVGFIVGKGITLGSGGVGGRKYQIAAVILTYAAVSMAAIPIWFHEISKATTIEQVQPQNSSSDSDPARAAAKPTDNKHADGQATSYAGALGRLALLGLASPFLDLTDFPWGIIGLLILLVGLRIAWRVTEESPLQLSGPYENKVAAPAGAGPGQS